MKPILYLSQSNQIESFIRFQVCKLNREHKKTGKLFKGQFTTADTAHQGGSKILNIKRA